MGNQQPGGHPIKLTTGGTPLKFSNIHSANVLISPDGRTSQRIKSFCEGICFSDRPIGVNEKVLLKLSEVSNSWSGYLRFGVTNHDPRIFSNGPLPKYVCPDLTVRPGYWAKALTDRYAALDNVLCFWCTRDGSVYYAVNGRQKGVFLTGVNTALPLWLVMDVYGNTCAVELLDPALILARRTASMPNAALNQQPVPVHGVPSPPPADHGRPQISIDLAATSRQPKRHRNRRRGESLANAPISLKPNNQVLANRLAAMPGRPHVANNQPTVTQPARDVTTTAVHFYRNVPWRSSGAALSSRLKGRNTNISTDLCTAIRTPGEYCNAYVFLSTPLEVGESFVIQILDVDQSFCGSLAFGMTSCDPETLSPSELPDDSDLLLDRTEYWVVHKDFCSQVESGDEWSFTLTANGEIRFCRNGSQPGSVLFVVDYTVPMWPFLDLYGKTQKVRLLGRTKCNLADFVPKPRPKANERRASVDGRQFIDGQNHSPGGPSSPSHVSDHRAAPPMVSAASLLDNISPTDKHVPRRPPPPVPAKPIFPPASSTALRSIPATASPPPAEAAPAPATAAILSSSSSSSSAVPPLQSIARPRPRPSAGSLSSPTPSATTQLADTTTHWQNNSQTALPKPLIPLPPSRVEPASSPALATDRGPSVSDSHETFLPASNTTPQPLDGFTLSNTNPFLEDLGEISRQPLQPSISLDSATVAQFLGDSASFFIDQVDDSPPHSPVPDAAAAADENAANERNASETPPEPTATTTTASSSSPPASTGPSTTTDASETTSPLEECTVCMERPVDCVPVPCGHMCMCYSCAIDVKNADGLCPICRIVIETVVRTYRC